MRGFKARIENLLAAIASGDTSREMNGKDDRTTQEVQSHSEKGLLSKIDRVMMAITFAEAGCPDTSRELLGCSEPVPAPSRSMAPSFAEAVGLQGVRLRYGVVELS